MPGTSDRETNIIPGATIEAANAAVDRLAQTGLALYLRLKGTSQLLEDVSRHGHTVSTQESTEPTTTKPIVHEWGGFKLKGQRLSAPSLRMDIVLTGTQAASMAIFLTAKGDPVEREQLEFKGGIARSRVLSLRRRLPEGQIVLVPPSAWYLKHVPLRRSE